MKKILISALVAVSMTAGALPASAQSANDWIRAQEATDPGYQSAVRSGGYGYYGDSYYVPPFPLLGLLFGGGHNRHHAGDVCYDGNGVMYGLDKQRRWYRVPGAEPIRMNAESTAMRCDFSGSSYAAAGR